MSIESHEQDELTSEKFVAVNETNKFPTGNCFYLKL